MDLGSKSWSFLEKASALRKGDNSYSHANNTDETFNSDFKSYIKYNRT